MCAPQNDQSSFHKRSSFVVVVRGGEGGPNTSCPSSSFSFIRENFEPSGCCAAGLAEHQNRLRLRPDPKTSRLHVSSSRARREGELCFCSLKRVSVPLSLSPDDCPTCFGVYYSESGKEHQRLFLSLPLSSSSLDSFMGGCRRRWRRSGDKFFFLPPPPPGR